jgi:hypothetical protein
VHITHYFPIAFWEAILQAILLLLLPALPAIIKTIEMSFVMSKCTSARSNNPYEMPRVPEKFPIQSTAALQK